jgi:hypothetical protein
LILILISNATLTTRSENEDSKLLQEDFYDQSIPETIPETQDEIPVIPEIPSSENN